ncbi:MAG: ribosomal-processing cysteine protease Prp [Solobacterium sp.]|nr:ribosomal-processing cysteine protease Prp [Solobacterium sp.]
MINVRVETQNNQITTMVVNGHAESDVHGNDLVCAGVSAIMFGLCNALDERMTNTKFEVTKNEFYIQSDLSQESETILRTGLIQLKTMEESYPKNIKIKQMEV